MNVQHNFHLRKQGDLPEQLFAFANCFSSGFVTHHFFSLATLVTAALGFDTIGVSSCFKASLLCWKESFHKYSNSAAGDKDREA